MFLYRKNIILVPTDYDGKSLTKGLLGVDCFDNKAICTFKSYNLDYENNLLLGVAINGKLYKQNLTEKNYKNFDFEIPQTVKNNDDISCVLIELKNGDYQIILWGSSQINNQWKSMLELMLEDNFNKKQDDVSQSSLKNSYQSDYNGMNNFDESLGHDFFGRNPNFEEKNQMTFDNEKDFQSQQNQEEVFVDESNSQSDAEIFSYKDAEINALIDKVIDMTENETNGNIKKDISDMTFYERISGQIDKMFRENRQEEVLNEILPNSKFCKVMFEDGSGYYVFGIIYDDGLPKYLCYGLPSKKESEPPTELSNLYQWLPIDANNEDSDGYYMMYQDASTGKNISVEII